MALSALILCSDEKIVRVVRRVLADLEIQSETCTEPSAALRKLTRQSFEALIVDCSEGGFQEVLRSARSAPRSGRAVAIAIADPAMALRSAFDLGAHFVLYKPVTSERAKLSFRAARALMKTERRRNTRILVRIPLALENGRGSYLKTTTVDLGEGGMAVHLPAGPKPNGIWKATFSLPDNPTPQVVSVELAWEGRERQGGMRFVKISAETTAAIQEWMKRSAPDLEPEDPPLTGRLSDLTPHACYIDISTPLPLSTRVTVALNADSAQVKVNGIVRVMHPERGMGIQFIVDTAVGVDVEKVLNSLSAGNPVPPEVLIEPHGLSQVDRLDASPSEESDPLLQLYNDASIITPESFFERLRQQRAGTPTVDPGRAQAASSIA